MANFRPTDRQISFLLPPSIDEWLPERHLARFVVKVTEGFDLSALSKSYRGTGSASAFRFIAANDHPEHDTAATGNKSGGKSPEPPVEGPLPKDQIQSDRRRIPHHASRGRRVRTMLQRPGGHGGGQFAGCRGHGDPGTQ